MTDHIVIVSATRTPMGHFGGYFKNTPTPQLGGTAIHGALNRRQSLKDHIDAVWMGCVLTAGLGQAPARQAALHAELSTKTPCTTINKMCGSGMQAVISAHDSIVAGSTQVAIAGGMENMSQAPYLIPKARFGYRLGHGQLIDHLQYDGLEDAYDPARHSMGYFAEQCAKKYNISRQAMDEFAIRSLQRAKKANEDGSFTQEIEPIDIQQHKKTVTIQHDENPLNAKLEKITQLKPAFIEKGSITAANASSISDGAAALILMRQSKATELNIKPLAKIVGHYSFAHQPSWFTTAPIFAIKNLMAQLNWQLSDIDLFEINEAFAVVTLAAIQALQINPDIVNIHGGACALGHPIGASGARIIVTLLHALQQHGLQRGIASLCIGGGEATALALEICKN